MAADADVAEKPVSTGAVGGADKGAAGAADAGAGAAPDTASKAAPAAAGGKQAPAGDPGKQAPAAGKPAPQARGNFLDDDGDDVDDETPAEDEKPTAKDGGEKELPTDWRELAKLAADGDEKAEARLNRLGSVKAMAKSLLNAEKKIRSGAYKKALPEDATEEEKAAWRKDNGIPDKPEDYKIPDVEGRKWDDADKPVINTFLQELHGANASQAVIDKMLATYAKVTAAQQEAAAEKDRADDLAIRDHMRDTLGNDFAPTRKLMVRALGDPEIFPGGLGAILKDARAPDGTKLINKAEFADWLANFSTENYGAGAMVTGEGDATLNSRESELVTMMRSDIDKYQNGRNAKGQTFADELLEIRQKKANSGGRMRRA